MWRAPAFTPQPKSAPTNCRTHQTWDFDCDTCVTVATNRVVNIKNRERRELVSTMQAPPSSRPVTGPRSLPRTQ